MPGRFKFEKLAEYPHMAPNDVRIWEIFLQKFPDYYESVDYDIRLGQGQFSPEEIGDNVYIENLAGLSKFRIDVIGFKKSGEIDCIEVRPRAGLSAFGSALGCAHLLRAQLSDKKIIPVVLTDLAQSDLEEICLAHGVELIETD